MPKGQPSDNGHIKDCASSPRDELLGAGRFPALCEAPSTWRRWVHRYHVEHPPQNPYVLRVHPNVYRSIFIVLYFIIALCIPLYAIETPSNHYGMCWRFPNVGNLQIGSPHNNYDLASFRFRAQHSGSVDSFRGYTMLAQGDTYSVGNGGTLRIELRTDDGTPNHLPSNIVLASFEHAVNADQLTRKADPIFGILDSGGTSFNKIYFSNPANLTAGQLYHIVFTNTSPQSASNWYSMDCIYNHSTVTPVQAAYSDTDLAVVTHGPGNSWRNPNAHYTPIYSLYWTDGYVQGQPYLQVGYVLGRMGFPIYGASHKIRQPFVPSDNQIVSAVNACVHRVGSPNALTITLQDSNLNTIATGKVPASKFPTSGIHNIRWGKVHFASPITLQKGVKYYVEVSTSGGDASNCYRCWSAENGKNYGFDSSAADGFKDGAYRGNYGQHMNGADWQTDHYDMPIYFDCGPILQRKE
jgi:hypothetical protein